MIMVDQLWLWLLEVHDHAGKTKTMIFTSFPQKEKEAGVDEKDLEDIADLRQAIIDEANSQDNDWGANRSNYIGLIIEQAVNVMLRVRTEESLDFLSIFRAAIGEAVSTYTRRLDHSIYTDLPSLSRPRLRPISSRASRKS